MAKLASDEKRVTATITPNGIDVVLENWDGVNANMIERIHYAIIQKDRVHRAIKLGALHAERMAADALAIKLEESKKLSTDEELANALQSI